MFFDSYNEKHNLAEVVRDQAKAKARFCLATGIAPSEYEQLTLIEQEEFIKEINKRNRKGAI